MEWEIRARAQRGPLIPASILSRPEWSPQDYHKGPLSDQKLSMNKKSLLLVLIILLWMAEAVFFRTAHPHFWFQKVSGFQALLGFLGALGLMFGAKALGNYWLYRKEDYYD